MKKLLLVSLFLFIISCDSPGVTKWSKGHIPYMLYGFTSSESALIIGCMTDLEILSMGRIKFVFSLISDKDIPDNTRILHIFKLGGMASGVFPPGGNEDYQHSVALSLITKRVVYHELMHVLGFPHEHQRPDRDSYIIVDFSKMTNSEITQFVYFDPEMYTYDYKKYPYDHRSIMHYNLSDCGYQVMTAPENIVMGNGSLSELDIKKLQELYEEE